MGNNCLCAALHDRRVNIQNHFHHITLPLLVATRGSRISEWKHLILVESVTILGKMSVGRLFCSALLFSLLLTMIILGSNNNGIDNIEKGGTLQDGSVNNHEMCYPTSNYHILQVDEVSRALILQSHSGLKEKTMGGDELLC